MIAIVAAVYTIAIILVAFLGIRAEIHNPTVNVENIFLRDTDSMEAGEIFTYYSSETQQDTTTRIYSILIRPTDENIDENHKDEEGNLWEINGNNYDYIVKIWNFNYIFENTNWRDGVSFFDLGAYAYPSDARQTLRYVLSNISEEYLTVNQNGILHFEKKFTSLTNFDLSIAATDTSGVKLKLNFISVPYIDI